jgi:hypothetical protein
MRPGRFRSPCRPITPVSVSVRVDGADAGSLIAAGDGLFTGELPVYGAIDNGSHEVEVIAKQGEFEDSRVAMYEVSTPKPGTEAWSKPGPTGSRTNRVALTPAGDLIEVGQTVDRRRAAADDPQAVGLSGAELWPEGTIVLDTREGAVVDVAVLPDGRMWVAMNVREPNKDPRPRLACSTRTARRPGSRPRAPPAAWSVPSRRTRRGAASPRASPGHGRLGRRVLADHAAGEQTLGDAFDYFPLDGKPHSFRTSPTTCVIDGDVVWVDRHERGAA